LVKHIYLLFERYGTNNERKNQFERRGSKWEDNINQKKWNGFKWLIIRSKYEYFINIATFYMMNWKQSEMLVAYIKILSLYHLGRNGSNQSLGQIQALVFPDTKKLSTAPNWASRTV
jgi:hypothetical protein